MKITKRQLRRIIKEEKARLIKEAGRPHSMREGRTVADLDREASMREKDPMSIAAETKTTSEWVEHLGQIIDQDMTSRGLTSYKEEGAAVIAALEQLRREIKDEMRGPTR